MSKGLAIIYDRASSKKQEENYTRQDVKRIGLDIASLYDYDTEPEPRVEIKSGEELKNRPVMLAILEEIESGQLIHGRPIRAIIVPNFTRLSRDEDVIDGMVIRKACRDNGVVVIDFNRKVYDFQKDNDQDTALIEFWFAARDKRQMLSNTMRGKKEKALRGEFNGGGPQTGYDLVPSGRINRKGVPMKKLVINPEEANLVRRIFKLYLEHSAVEIAGMLNAAGTLRPVKYPKNLKTKQGDTKFRLWETNDIIRILDNPTYAGWIHWSPRPGKNGEVHKFLRDIEPQMHFDPSLQIISQQEFDRVQELKKERKRVPSRSANSPLPFSYVLKCPHCDGPLGGNLKFRKEWDALADDIKGEKSYLEHSYRCISHLENPHLCRTGYNIAFMVAATAIIPHIVTIFRTKWHLPDLLREAAKEYSTTTALERLEAQTRAELEKVQQSLKRVTDSIAAGVLTFEEANEKLGELREKRERLQRDLQSFSEQKTLREDLLEAIEYLDGNLQAALWRLAVEKPTIMTRILRLVFRPHSIVVEAYWDKEEKVRIPSEIKLRNGTKRRGRLISCELLDPFGLAGGSGDNTDEDGREHEVDGSYFTLQDGVNTKPVIPRASSSPGRRRRWSARRWPPCAPRR